LTGLGSLLWCVVWYFSGFQDRCGVASPASRCQAATRQDFLAAVFSNRAILGIAGGEVHTGLPAWLFLTWVPLLSGHGAALLDRQDGHLRFAFPMPLPCISQPICGMCSDWLISSVGASIAPARRSRSCFRSFLYRNRGGICRRSHDRRLLPDASRSPPNPTPAGHTGSHLGSDSAKDGRLVGGLINLFGSAAGILSPILTLVVS